MHLELFLFSMLLMDGVIAQDPPAGGGKPPKKDAVRENRKDVEIPQAELDTQVPAVLVQSKDVPFFHNFDSFFSTIYPMTCGSSVQVGPNIDGVARCNPDFNDIVQIQADDQLEAELCMRVLICKPGVGNEMCKQDSIKLWFPYGRKVVDISSVKDYAPSTIEVKKGELVINVDPGCQLKLNFAHFMRHRFLNKPPKIRQIMKKYPGFYLQPSFHHPRRLYKGGNSVFLGESLQLGKNVLKKIKCNAECDEGQMFYFKMNPNSPFYSKIFVDAAICEWFKVCIGGQQGAVTEKFFCRDADMVNVYVKNAFVVMPGALNGATIRLAKSSKPGSRGDMHKKRPTQIGFDYDGERFSIWSVGRERVASSASVNHDGHIILYFSDHNCLIKKYGIMRLGENNGIVYQIDEKKPVDNVSTGKGDFVTYSPAPTRSPLPTVETEKPTPNASAVAAATTTAPRDIGDLLGGGDGTAGKKARTGWLIWAIFYGFFVGCLIALILGGLILYFARRTFYADWYRGMYKRYGCDASGVTGGVTGSQFGATSTGAGGLSTMGTTTGGGTTGSNSTMGTTGGGSTMGGTPTSTSGGTTGGTEGGTTGGGTTGGDTVPM
ncbi:hypothetical protein RB195_009038 [Necator americanus]|uniref:Uncharacterized protein n=1 Tax=Necator americanus TaxID=51031 RepID=A0ABR1CRG7_NECAM